MIQIHQMALSTDGGTVEIGFTDLPGDARVGGKVVIYRTVSIDLSHPDYRDDADQMIHWAKELVRNALDDWDNAPPGDVPAEPERDDDEEGLGMGHGSRS